ncbi:hypothetical protein MATL_G00224770, partial [Megalops atlanticus]
MAAQQVKLPLSSGTGKRLVTLLLTLSCLLSEALPQDAGRLHPAGEEPACDGHQVDVCGVCAGDSSSCDVVSGTFSRSVLSVGYHKILEIPSGAQNIRIQEMVKSRNYLALRTAGGDSIINGKWAIDRPGVFFAAGTQLTYRRPNEIRSRTGESITALGPTSQELHLYLIYQQPSPSVLYEYILPKENTLSPQPAPPPHVQPLAETQGLYAVEGQGYSLPDANGVNGVHPNQVLSDPLSPTPNGPGPQLHPGLLSSYTWRRTGTTLCSATCGTGRRQVVFSCVDQVTGTVVPGDLCELSQRPASQAEDCNTQ